MHTKKHSIVYRTLCVKVGHSYGMGQPHSQPSLAGKCSIASLTAHWSNYISFCSTSELQSLVPPLKSSDRFPMITGRGSCRQDSLEGPRRSSNCGKGWINLVDTSGLSPPWEFAIYSSPVVFQVRCRDVAKFGQTRGTVGLPLSGM